MIKIHLENKEEICNKHYNGCKDLILRRIERNLIKNKNSNYCDLLNFIKERLEDIITKKPDGLVAIYYEVNKKFAQFFIHNNPHAFKLIDKILNYNSFSAKATSTTKWDAYKLAQALNVSVCPYCNRLYTKTVITKKGDKIIRPDFDHFFPQALYPLFQMSFYNLIPSCTICNSRLKGNRYVNPKKLEKYIHPYLDGFEDDGKFSFTLILKDKTNDFYSKENIRVEVTNSKLQPLSKCKLKIKNNCEMFKIEEIYQMHTDVVSEMIEKFTIYNDIYVEFLKNFNSLGLTKSEIYKLAFGNFYEEKDFQKRPLSKLTRDIYDELSGITSGRIIQKWKLRKM